jgi:hypothetical protein
MTYPQLPSPPPPPLGGVAKGKQGLTIALSVAVIAFAAGAGVVIARSTKDTSTSATSSFVDSSSSFESSVSSADDTPPRAHRDHFHAVYAIDICGTEQPPLDDVGSDAHGIHTHGDSLIHIHPFDETASGARATLSVFFEQTGVQLTDTSLTIRNRGTKTEGRDRCEGKDSELVVLVWLSADDADAGRPADETHTTDMGNVRLRQGEVITIAFRAKGASVAGPSNAVDKLASVSNVGPPTSQRGTTTTTRPTSTSTA